MVGLDTRQPLFTPSQMQLVKQFELHPCTDVVRPEGMQSVTMCMVCGSQRVRSSALRTCYCPNRMRILGPFQNCILPYQSIMNFYKLQKAVKRSICTNLNYARKRQIECHLQVKFHCVTDWSTLHSLSILQYTTTVEENSHVTSFIALWDNGIT